MEKSTLYSILIPTYNERENIAILIYMINKYLSTNSIKYEIVIVDDNSPDKTQEIIEEMIKFYGADKIKLLSRPKKLGLGSAYIEGSKLCSGDFIIIMDADFSHHPKFLVDYIKKQKETNADIVTGTRYTNGGGVYGWNVIRKLISRGANFFASFFLNPKVSDLTGSFRIYKKEIFDDLITVVKNSGYAFQMEMMVRAKYKGLKIEEIPISFVDRLMGKSKLGLPEIILYLKTVMNLYFTL